MSCAKSAASMSRRASHANRKETVLIWSSTANECCATSILIALVFELINSLTSAALVPRLTNLSQNTIIQLIANRHYHAISIHEVLLRSPTEQDNVTINWATERTATITAQLPQRKTLRKRNANYQNNEISPRTGGTMAGLLWFALSRRSASTCIRMFRTRAWVEINLSTSYVPYQVCARGVLFESSSLDTSEKRDLR